MAAMADKADLARSLASEALTDLSTPGTPIQVALLKAIRVAALKGHAYWRAWLTLQLTDGGSEHSAVRIQEQIASTLPDSETAQAVTKQVALDYMTSRSIANQPTKIYGASIEELEGFVKRNQRLASIAPADVSEIINELRGMFARIRNRISDYLIGVESGD